MKKSIKDRVMEVLLARQGYWTVSTHIARAADCNSGPSEPSVRAAIALLIAEGVPIVSCECGYKIAETEAEVVRASQDLHMRAEEIRVRAHTLHLAWEKWNLANDL